MAFKKWVGANGQGGAPSGVEEIYVPDPDAQAALQQRKHEFDVTSGQQEARDRYKMSIFDKLYGASGQYGAVGGTTQPQPTITRGPLYSQQQIDQQVNQGVAANDARYQTLMKQLGESAAARGLGMRSPAIQAQMTQLGIANIGDNARTEMATPMRYLQANADQTFRTDQLAQQQWMGGEDVDIRRRQQQLQQLNALLSSLGGF